MDSGSKWTCPKLNCYSKQRGAFSASNHGWLLDSNAFQWKGGPVSARSWVLSLRAVFSTWLGIPGLLSQNTRKLQYGLEITTKLIVLCLCVFKISVWISSDPVQLQPVSSTFWCSVCVLLGGVWPRETGGIQVELPGPVHLFCWLWGLQVQTYRQTCTSCVLHITTQMWALRFLYTRMYMYVLYF